MTDVIIDRQRLTALQNAAPVREGPIPRLTGAEHHADQRSRARGHVVAARPAHRRVATVRPAEQRSVPADKRAPPPGHHSTRKSTELTCDVGNLVERLGRRHQVSDLHCVAT